MSLCVQVLESLTSTQIPPITLMSSTAWFWGNFSTIFSSKTSLLSARTGDTFKKKSLSFLILHTHAGEAWQVSQWWRTPPTSFPLWWSWTPAFPLDLTLLRRRTCWRWEIILGPKYLFYFSVIFVQLLPFTVWRTSVLLFGTLLPVHLLFSRFLKSEYK